MTKDLHSLLRDAEESLNRGDTYSLSDALAARQRRRERERVERERRERAEHERELRERAEKEMERKQERKRNGRDERDR